MVTRGPLLKRVGLVIAVVGFLLPPSVIAQTGGTDSTAGPVTPQATSFRQFGVWLDDAATLPRGDGFLSVGVGEWRISNIRFNDALLSGGIAVTDRLQLNTIVAYYRYALGGIRFEGMDEVYLGAKFNILDPRLTVSEFGLSVSPTVEMLSADVPGDRIHFILPVNMEFRRAPFRVYGSVGYFTRGSAFSGAAIEWRTPFRVVLTGAATQSYSVKKDPLLDELSVSRQRVDVNGTAVLRLIKRSAVYVTIGRTVHGLNEGGTKLARVAGLAIGF